MVPRAGSPAPPPAQSEQNRPTPSLLAIFLPFLRLGLTSFGGPAMVAYVRNLAVKKKQWLSGDSFSDGVALCQSIPGATAMQSTAYVGLKARGFSGAAAAYVGFGLPAFVFMLVLSVLYKYGQEAPLILSLFSGLRAIVVALMANAALSFGTTTIKSWWGLPVVAGAAVALFFGVNPIYVIFAAAAVGLALPLTAGAAPSAGAEHESASEAPLVPACSLASSGRRRRRHGHPLHIQAAVVRPGPDHAPGRSLRLRRRLRLRSLSCSTRSWTSTTGCRPRYS